MCEVKSNRNVGSEPVVDVVLVRPLIPQNTGSIARSCAALKFPLHLIEPLGFEINERRVRRAGLDYWPHVDLSTHSSWDNYIANRRPQQVWMFSKFAKRPYWESRFEPGDAIVFGSETTGLGEALLESIPEDNRLILPMRCTEVRSLNLSNAVSVVMYEVLRQFETQRTSDQ